MIVLTLLLCDLTIEFLSTLLGQVELWSIYVYIYIYILYRCRINRLSVYLGSLLALLRARTRFVDFTQALERRRCTRHKAGLGWARLRGGDGAEAMRTAPGLENESGTPYLARYVWWNLGSCSPPLSSIPYCGVLEWKIRKKTHGAHFLKAFYRRKNYEKAAEIRKLRG